MTGLLGLLAIYLLINSLLVGLGVGVGYLLRWVCGIDLGIGILIGIISASISIYFLGRIPSIPDKEDSGEEDETPIRIYSFDSGRRKQRKRKDYR